MQVQVPNEILHTSEVMSLTLNLNKNNVLKALQRETRLKSSRQPPISKIRIKCVNGEFWSGMGASLSDSDLILIFQRIGHAFPCLQELHMKEFELPLPSMALVALLRATRYTLQVIDMADVILKGKPQELEDLATFFQGHPSLQTLRLDWCQPLCGNLEPVFCTLSTIPNLTQVMFCGSFPSAPSIRDLCCKQSIKRLSLLDDDLGNNGMNAISESLGKNQHIQELSLRLMHLEFDTGQRFSNALRLNHSLKNLEIRIRDSDWNSYGTSFVTALHHNTTLTTFTLFIDGNGIQITATAEQLGSCFLQHSSLKSLRIVLRGLHIHSDYPSLQNAFEGPLRTMLQSNIILEELQVDGVPSLPFDVDFYLKANRLGRGKLLQDPSNQQLWLQTLIANRQNVAFTHFLLSMNPALCPCPSRSTVWFV